MYNYIESNASIIRINRGDFYQAPLFINEGTVLEPKRHIIQSDEKVYFGIMEPNKLWEQSILRQIYTSESEMTEDGDLIITIPSKDTEFLIPGTYYYMVKLVKYSDKEEVDKVITVVPATLFYII